MAKIPFKSRRPELSLNEVLEQYECTVDDLFHEAAMGKLPIYVLVSGSNAFGISDIDRSKEKVDLSIFFTKEPFLSNGFAWVHPQSVPSESTYKNFDFTPDVVISGNQVDYKKTEANLEIYKHYWSGLQQIALETFKDYRNGDASATIKLNVSKNFSITNPMVERIAYLEASILLQEALNDKKLFVMKEDLQKLSDQPTDPDDAKPKGGVVRKTLLKLIRGLAEGCYHYKPNVKNVALKDIQIDIANAGFRLDDETIRKALKEADLLSQDPQEDTPRKPA